MGLEGGRQGRGHGQGAPQGAEKEGFPFTGVPPTAWAFLRLSWAMRARPGVACGQQSRARHVWAAWWGPFLQKLSPTWAVGLERSGASYEKVGKNPGAWGTWQVRCAPSEP